MLLDAPGEGPAPQPKNRPAATPPGSAPRTAGPAQDSKRPDETADAAPEHPDNTKNDAAPDKTHPAGKAEAAPDETRSAGNAEVAPDETRPAGDAEAAPDETHPAGDAKAAQIEVETAIVVAPTGDAEARDGASPEADAIAADPKAAAVPGPQAPAAPVNATGDGARETKTAAVPGPQPPAAPVNAAGDCGSETKTAADTDDDDGAPAAPVETVKDDSGQRPARASGAASKSGRSAGETIKSDEPGPSSESRPAAPDQEAANETGEAAPQDRKGRAPESVPQDGAGKARQQTDARPDPAHTDETNIPTAARAGETAHQGRGPLGDTHPAGVPQPAERIGMQTTNALPASTAANAPVPIAGLAVEIAARAQAGRNRFEIRLDPPELGRIDVRLDVDRNGNVTSRLVVERAETLEVLRRDAGQLERALQDAGLKTSDNGLQFMLRDQSLAGRDDGQREPRARIVVPDADLAGIDAGEIDYRGSTHTGGLDIRV